MLRKRNVLIILSDALLISIIVVLLVMMNISTTEASNVQAELSSLKTELSTLQTDLDATNKELLTAKNSNNYINSQYEDAMKRLNSATSELNSQKLLTQEAQKEAASWKKKFMDLDPENATYEYSFDNVKDLLVAIKSNPYAYYNKNVKVIGWVYKESDSYETVLVSDGIMDLSANHGYSIAHEVWLARQNNSAVNLTFLTELEYAVLDSGDYVKLYGTILIDNSGEILLSDCTYELITPAQ